MSNTVDKELFLGVDGGQCEIVYEKYGAEKFNLCNIAYQKGKTKHAKQYEQKLLDGYSGTFADFETERKAKLKELGMGGLSMGLGLLDSFLKDNDSEDAPTSNNHSATVTVDEEPKSKVGLYVGIGIGVAVLGIVAYKVFGKKGKS